MSAVCLGLASPSSPWLVCFSLLALFLAIRLLPPFRAMLCGALWGAVFCGVSSVFGAPRITASITAVALLTTVPALYAAGGALLTRWVGFSPLALATGWIVMELALAPLGLRAGLLAGAVADGAALQFVGGAVGYVFISFVVAYASAWLLEFAVAARLWTMRPLRRTVTSNPSNLPALRAVAWSSLSSVRISQPRAPPA